MRWALAGAIQHVPVGHPLRQRRDDIIARRGKEAKNIAKIAMARQLLGSALTKITRITPILWSELCGSTTSFLSACRPVVDPFSGASS